MSDVEYVEHSALVRPPRIVVGVSGSASSAAALRRGVVEARRASERSQLIALLAWEPPGGEAVYRLSPEPGLAAVWARNADERLEAAVLDALGAIPYGLDFELLTARAPAAYALNAVADRVTDLLVLGAGERNPLSRLLFGPVRRGAISRAIAPVLLVAPPRSPRRLSRELRKLEPEDFLPPR